MKLGVHVSISKSICRAVDRALALGCNVFQMFSRNPRRWQSGRLSSEEVILFKEKLKLSDIWPPFIHTPYLLNLASPRREVYLKSVEVLKDELSRAGVLGVPYVVTHLGSHLGHGVKGGVNRIIKGVDSSLSKVKNGVVLLLENSAGFRNSVGSYFDEIQSIIIEIRNAERVGVCFDTCHAYAAGYDLVSREAVEGLIHRFDEVVGFSRIKLVHLNDSKGGLGSKIDRHEHIGMGKIGEGGFRTILKSKLGRRPLILETPVDKRRGDFGNLRKVCDLASG